MKVRPNGKTYPPCHLVSEGGNPLTKYVNLCQTPEERRDKYGFVRFFGFSRTHANRMRDWHWTKINLFLQSYNKTLPLPLSADEP